MQKYEIIHFLYTPFTGLGLHGGYRGHKWLKDRIRIFKQYTLPSILNQTSKNFVLWISWRPEDINNPLVEQLGETLEGIRGLTTYFTYGGICFWDDKYKDDNLQERLTKTLPHLAEGMKTLPYSDKVLMTIQPSDDMYIDTAVQDIQDKYFKDPQDKMAIGWRKGYIMNYATKELAEYSTVDWTTDDTSTYHTNTIPPFFTIAFPRETFEDPDMHYKHIGPYKSHEDILDIMPYETIPGRGFCVGTHGANISTTFNHRYQGKMLKGKEKERMLFTFGVYYSDPVVIRQGFRYVLRRVLNMLPFNNKIRQLYHLIPNKYKIL